MQLSHRTADAQIGLFRDGQIDTDEKPLAGFAAGASAVGFSALIGLLALALALSGGAGADSGSAAEIPLAKMPVDSTAKVQSQENRRTPLRRGGHRHVLPAP